MLYYAYGVNASLAVNVLIIGAEELIACYGAGFPLLLFLERHRGIFR
jgi:hypothetical protein